MGKPACRTDSIRRTVKFRLAIFTASGALLGSGHLHRMQILARLLEKNFHVSLYNLAPFLGRFQTRAFFLNSEGKDLIKKQAAKAQGLLVDLRDIEPEVFFFPELPVFFLDNRHPKRKSLEEALAKRPHLQILRNERNTKKQAQQDLPAWPNAEKLFFYDTLPHPALSIETIQKQLWIPRLPSRQKELQSETSLLPNLPKSPKDSKKALLYTGTLPSKELGWLSDFIEKLLSEQKLDFLLQIGTERLGPKHPSHAWHARLPVPKFQERIKKSDYVFSYFGLSLFEAWAQKKIPVLYEIETQEHKLLSRDLSKRSNMLYLTKRKLSRLDKKHWPALLPEAPPAIQPAKTGQEQLLGIIQKFFQSQGKAWSDE